jgi:hypothetical protein
MSPKEERQNPWFMNKESSEIMIACFNLEAQELRDVSSPLTNQTASSLDDIVDHILQINRFLYGPNFVKHLVSLVLQEYSHISKHGVVV